jgi:hypothetical protein
MSDNTTTIRMVVYDLLGDLKQVYSEAVLSPFKVFYWVMVFADRLRKQHVEKLDSGAYVYKFDDIAVEVEPTTGRNRFELPAAIYDFDEDNGIDYITYQNAWDLSLPMFASITFTRTTPAKAARLYFREEERPTPANPYFYRQNKYIYLLGTEEINITKVEAGLKTSLASAALDTDIDAPFDFPQDLIPVLKRQILDIGRFVMQIPADLINDGAAFDSKQFPTQKIVSVNDPDTTNAQRYQQQQYNQD